MLTATLQMIREVSLPGSKLHWKIKHDEVVTVDGEAFVKLSATNSSLSSLLGNKGGYLCLSRSHGYKALVELRNKEAGLAKEEEIRQAECNLFDDAKKFKIVRSRTAMADDRQHNHRTITVSIGFPPNIPSQAVLLRPVHPSDAVHIKFEGVTVSAVLDWLGKHEFSGAYKRTRNPDMLPKGISRHASGFIVAYTAEDGRVKRKLLHELDAALAFHADPSAVDEDTEDGRELNGQHNRA